MSNNLVSQQMSLPNMQMGQLEPILNKVDPLVQEMQMGLMGSASGGPAAYQHSISNKQVELADPLSGNLGLQRPSMPNMQTLGIEPRENNLGFQQFLPHRQLGPMETKLNSAGSQQFSAPMKRKTPMEPPYINSAAHLSVPNKRVAQLEHRPWLQQASGPNKKAIHVLSMSTTPGSQHSPTPNKKVGSSKSGSQRTSTPKNQTATMLPSPKVHTDSFESVRSKMRESLAAALALVSQQKEDKCSSPEKNFQNNSASSPGQIQKNTQHAESVSAAAGAVENVSVEPKVTLPSHDDHSAPKINNSESLPAKISAAENIADYTQTMKSDGQETQSTNVFPAEDVSFSDDFFAKDELLQGNGLSWVLDSDMQVVDKREFHTTEKRKLEHDGLVRDQKEESVQTPETVAFNIEAELFKLFGGVNKKYKEKGRSLLFNLKDRNNPELREKVMSGDIPPERLCSMTAEELASKELSEWRIAKAEELAQMVVLPDAEVDIRRLVKKTHKGEFQVEVEPDDTVPMDVSVGASSLTQRESKSKEMESPRPSKPDGARDEVDTKGEKSNLDDQSTGYTLTIPSSEGTDLMQGLMVDDALKDAEFLPPIVSLDEFMESLDSEPPFENLPVDAGKHSDEDDSEPSSESKSPETTPRDFDITTDEPEKVDATYSKLDGGQKSNDGDASGKCSEEHADMKPGDGQPDDSETAKPSNAHIDANSTDRHAEVKTSESNADLKTSDHRAKSESVPPAGISMVDFIWEGLLQLNTSATASVIGIFKSGEKTSAKEWSSTLEIKGRVRLDAFEKFLQELPLSRSRAVMVMHFVVAEKGSPERERGSLNEVADSYVWDERVGFAEPAPGVELYFCPPHNRTRETLSKILSTDHIEALNNIDNGLIGVIVWRKAQLTSRISPNSSHQKHKKQNISSRRQQETNLNPNSTPKPNPSRGLTPTNFEPSPGDDDDDVPPGFGPAAPRDEDDLPEFNFSGRSVSQPRFAQNSPRGRRPTHSVSQAPARPVDQMRELIQKYGQPQPSASAENWQDNTGFGVAVQPWNDDDDDIPEWQPQAPQQQLPPQQPLHSFHQPVSRTHLVNQPSNQSMTSVQSLQPPISLTQASQGTWWVPPVQGSAQQPNNLGCQPTAGQFYGAPVRNVGQPGQAWRQNPPKSRGF